MTTIALVAALAGSAAPFAAGPQENTEFAPDRHAAVAGMRAAD
ncbi:MAG: hypothetical protein AAF390_00710 [Pseudomonadota bacterium]